MPVDGKYDVTMNTPMGQQKAIITLVADGNSLSGEMLSMMGTVAFEGGTVEGDKLKWGANVNTPMGLIDMQCSATLEGDTLTGETTMGALGSATFTGTRTE